MHMITQVRRIPLDPMHRGHHAVFEDTHFHVDICNMVDDVVVARRANDTIYRFPITWELLPWLRSLVAAMDDKDHMSWTPGQTLSIRTRDKLLATAVLRLQGNPPRLNVFEPGPVFPSPEVPAVDAILETIIRDTPDALVGVPGQAWNPSRIITRWQAATVSA